MTYAFDTLKFTQRLEHVGVTREQAVVHAELARDMILADVATKQDLDALASSLKGETSAIRSDLAGGRREIESSLRELELRMTIKLGAIAAAAIALMTALQKLL